MFSRLVLVFAVLASAYGKIYFEETFDNLDNWVQSESRDDLASFSLSSGEWSADPKETQGMLTGEGMKFYAASSKLDKSFSNRDKDLVIQYTVKHESNEYSFCGGGYIKLLPFDTDQQAFNGDSPYHIMFGPDRCGYDVSRIHAIFNDGSENLLKDSDVKLEYGDKNEFTHLYTMIVHPDNTYDIQFDGKSKASGNIIEDWGFEKKEIPDPDDKKPADWVDEKEIPDPDEVKPEGYDDIPEKIVDPEAEQPDDWDEEDDGEWEAPLIDNPEYKGPWKPTMIANPDYKGEWKAKRVANPKYKDDVYAFDDIGVVGFELWIVNQGTIFDNIIITDSVSEAEAHAKKHFHAIVEAEQEVKKELDDAKEAEEAAKKKAEEAAKEEEEAEDDEDEDEDEEDSHDEL